MSYASQFTGGDADSRRAEADKLLDLLRDHAEEMQPKERRFVEQMLDDVEQPVTGKQVLWLRDLASKYVS